tara:strand:- start:439 stop:834 length:396 start_codon:yes stop_codon:yes gene_type:complete
MAEYFTTALLSIMIFYSFGIAFNVHKTLDKENAGKLLRKLFPLYFLWGIIISIFVEIIFLYQGTSIKALLMAIVAIGFLYSRQVLVPLLNKNRDLANQGDEEAKKFFGSLHLRSVSINIIQMVLLVVILIL